MGKSLNTSPVGGTVWGRAAHKKKKEEEEEKEKRMKNTNEKEMWHMEIKMGPP